MSKLLTRAKRFFRSVLGRNREVIYNVPLVQEFKEDETYTKFNLYTERVIIQDIVNKKSTGKRTILRSKMRPAAIGSSYIWNDGKAANKLAVHFSNDEFQTELKEFNIKYRAALNGEINKYTKMKAATPGFTDHYDATIADLTSALGRMRCHNFKPILEYSSDTSNQKSANADNMHAFFLIGSPQPCDDFALMHSRLGLLSAHDGCGNIIDKSFTCLCLPLSNMPEMPLIVEKLFATEVRDAMPSSNNAAPVEQKPGMTGLDQLEADVSALKIEHDKAMSKMAAAPSAYRADVEMSEAIGAAKPTYVRTMRVLLPQLIATNVITAWQKYTKLLCPAFPLPDYWLRGAISTSIAASVQEASPADLLSVAMRTQYKSFLLTKVVSDDADKFFYQIEVPTLVNAGSINMKDAKSGKTVTKDAGAVTLGNDRYCVWRRYGHFELLANLPDVKENADTYVTAAAEAVTKAAKKKNKAPDQRESHFVTLIQALAKSNDKRAQAALLDFVTPDAELRAGVRQRSIEAAQFPEQSDVEKTMLSRAASEDLYDGGLSFFTPSDMWLFQVKYAGPKVDFSKKDNTRAKQQKWLTCGASSP